MDLYKDFAETIDYTFFFKVTEIPFTSLREVFFMAVWDILAFHAFGLLGRSFAREREKSNWINKNAKSAPFEIACDTDTL